ncbi:hypothetical protein BATDEDRAFT_34496 [Batrachochytrium dendrobatidis JAM81]|uniref:MYND-type domain-containing protein n=2 Tax=Batrachochytrium dendrobatidis TaxID=109871 RepID=F4NWQ8_BATDJ|nr:uncharacterized protein BATDEDRAFT_34496 [Batrachochytrium dendrobatidis JAM81]EGF82527.1 hypothetical protein BATDEDRAFT_34496 [Batrachochytrium dendrobatidis JAM81]OAJ39446.1 hypothetical protein BDEG_23292 [Batrachochytrium dendrobatidis JEL423]|eukprot:XP_006676825.1 hypothetical protein BATDEDRAFT_34496 [Batrachochytrium dendrobatidis JAM81]
MNSTTNSTTNSTAGPDSGAVPPTGGIIEALMLLVFDVLAFVSQLQSDPKGAISNHQHLVVLLLIMLVTPILFKLISKFSLSTQAGVDLRLAGNVEEEAKELEEEICKAPVTEAIWEIGVSAKSASVVEEGVVRVVAFTKNLRPPTAEHIVATLIKAIARPEFLTKSPVRRPKIAMFLSSRTCSDAIVSKVASIMNDKCGIRVTTSEALAPELSKIQKKRSKEILQQEAKDQVTTPRGVKNLDIKLLPMPNRFCFTCKKEILTKPSQCSACKAVIYCSAECAKKDWPQHKPMCGLLKINVAHLEEWKLHNLPFDFYTEKSPLASYNQVPFLSQQGYHNVGIFRRLCGCYNNVACGEMAANMLAQIQDTNPSAQEKFTMLGLPDEMYPLSKPFPKDFDVNTIVDWKTLFEARGWSFDNPAALVLDIPMTIWYLTNRFVIQGLAAQKKEPCLITIHLVGVEIEADYMGLFEVLLPMFPGCHVAIHMIGPSISKDIKAKHRSIAMRSEASDSSIFISFNTDLYLPKYLEGTAFPIPPNLPDEIKTKFNFGVGKPDLVIALNAAVMSYKEWKPCVQMLIEANQKAVFTDGLEQMGDALGSNLPHLGSKLSVKATPNPFRHPVYQYKPDVNLPSWSNGFYFGIGPL